MLDMCERKEDSLLLLPISLPLPLPENSLITLDSGSTNHVSFLSLQHTFGLMYLIFQGAKPNVIIMLWSAFLKLNIRSDTC